MAWTERFDYVPIVDRKVLKLPDDARVAVWVIVNIEEWDIYHPMARTVLPPPGGGINPPPDVPNYSWYDYGLRVGADRDRLHHRLGVVGVRTNPLLLSLGRLVLGFAVGGRRRPRPCTSPSCRRRSTAAGWAVLPDRDRRRHRDLDDRRRLGGHRLAHLDRSGRGTGRDHVGAHAAAAGEPAVVRQARRPRRTREVLQRVVPPGTTSTANWTRSPTWPGRTAGQDPRVVGAPRAMGASGAGGRVRDRHLHPAERDRDDHLLLADDPDRYGFSTPRAPGLRRARRDLPGRAAGRADASTGSADGG